MPNYSIVKADNFVYVDGKSMQVDCSQLPEFFHAIQWYGSTSPAWGEIEFSADDQGRRMPNIRIVDFSPFQYLIEAWEAAALAVEQEAALAAAERAKASEAE